MPVLIFARKLRAICRWGRVWCPVRITLKGDRRHGNGGPFRETLFQVVVLGFTFGDADPPSIIMDGDGDVVRVVKRRCGTIECGIVEVQLRRSLLPDELCEIMRVFPVTGQAILRGEVILVPPQEFSL